MCEELGAGCPENMTKTSCPQCEITCEAPAKESCECEEDCGCISGYARTEAGGCVKYQDCPKFTYARECFTPDDSPTGVIPTSERYPKQGETKFQCVEHYICVQGQLFEWTCPPGLAFNPDTRMCGDSSEVENCHEVASMQELCTTGELISSARVLFCGYLNYFRMSKRGLLSIRWRLHLRGQFCRAPLRLPRV